MQSISVKTRKRNELVDITSEISRIVDQQDVVEGVVVVYVPHTTAGVTINENADPSVCHDILLTLEELIPERRRGYQHSEGNSDAHVKASLMGSSVQVIIDRGRMNLGTWQGIYFCEFDGPRNRSCLVKVIKV